MRTTRANPELVIKLFNANTKRIKAYTELLKMECKGDRDNNIRKNIFTVLETILSTTDHMLFIKED